MKTKLYNLMNGQVYIWPEDGQKYAVDHHDTMCTHSINIKTKERVLHYAPTIVERANIR